jgi:signal peptidase I
MYVFVKIFRYLKLGKNPSLSKLIKSFLVIIFVPNIVFLILDWINSLIGLGDPRPIFGMGTIVFLFLWVWVLNVKIGLSFKKTLIFLLVYFALTSPLNYALRFFVNPYVVPAGSMEDTISFGDYLIADKIYYGHSFFNKTSRYFQFHQPQRRDVIIFIYPEDHSKDFIKRCIGIPGDVIQIRGADLYVNGEKQVEPYVKHLFTPAEILKEEGPNSPKINFGPVTVSPGNYFMLGDNRDNSLDSRYWGQLDEKLIIGKACVTYWSGKNHWFQFKEIN